MSAEAEGMAAPSNRFRDRLTVAVGSGACTVCEDDLSSGDGTGVRVCERCLFCLPLEPAAAGVGHADEERQSPSCDALELGPYVLLEEIGRGGQGVVFKALHRETKEVVAVKTVLPQDAGCLETLTRFQREAAAAQCLEHPNSMRVGEVGCSTAGVPFFSMKLALGGNLHHLGKKYWGRWRQIAELLVKISSAVHHAHERGILHRDLKPGNILFTEDHEPLVTDFGLAKQLCGSTDLTQSCTVLGTPNYVSPEQAGGRTKDLAPASDVYSLGAILYELLTGRPPFVGDNALAVLQQAAKHSPPRVRRLAPSVPKTMETICMRCLERRPEYRYASARDLGDDLECWLQGRRIACRPLYVQWWGTIRLRKAIFAWSVGATVVILALLVAGIVVGRRKFNHERMTSIAVAIDDFGQDSLSKDLARRVTDGLRNELSQNAVFRVPDTDISDHDSSTELFDPLAYGRRSNAEMILTGCVWHLAEHVRIVIRLLRCDTGAVIWRHTTSVPAEQVMSDLPAVMKTVAGQVKERWRSEAGMFKAALSPSPDALAFYTKAMELSAHKNRQDLNAAVKLFRRSCAVDTQFVQARAMLAFALFTTANLYGESDLFSLAVSTAKQALNQDPDCAQAHRVIASCYFQDGRYEEALAEFQRAVESDPQSAGCVQSLGMCLREMGQPGRAIPWFTRAVRLAPAQGAFSASLGETLALCGRDDDAERTLKRAAELDSDRPDAQLDISALRVLQQRFDDARRLCASARQRFPKCRYGLSLAAWIEFCDGHLDEAKADFEALRAEHSYLRNWEFYGAVNPSSALASLAMRVGAIEQANLLADEALKIDRELLSKNSRNPRILHDLSATFAVIGDYKRSQEHLEKAIAAGWVEHRSTRIDPRFSGIATTSQFKDLLNNTFPRLPEDEPAPKPPSNKWAVSIMK